MGFEKNYNKIRVCFGESADKAHIVFNDDLKVFLQKSIENLNFVSYTDRNEEYLEHIILSDNVDEYSLYYDPGSEALNLIPIKEEKISDIVSRLDSTLKLRIYSNHYGQTTAEKEYFNANGAFKEIYDIDGRKIQTSVYKISDFAGAPEYFTTNLSTLFYGRTHCFKPVSKVKAETRGMYYVIDSGEGELLIPREENTTLYSVYYDYMVEKGYYYANSKDNLIKQNCK